MNATTTLPERPLYLVMLPLGPAIWAAHFFATYVTAALWCSPALPGDTLDGAHAVIAAFTAVALVGIAAVGWSGYRRHSFGAATLPHDDDSPEDRHRFLGFATMLLAGLSAVATLYVGVSTAFFSTCGG